MLRVAQPLYSCAWHPHEPTIAAAGGGGVYLFTYRDRDEVGAFQPEIRAGIAARARDFRELEPRGQFLEPGKAQLP